MDQGFFRSTNRLDNTRPERQTNDYGTRVSQSGQMCTTTIIAAPGWNKVLIGVDDRLISGQEYKDRDGNYNGLYSLSM